MRKWKLVAHVGNHPSLALPSGGRCFPHVHVNCDNLGHDRTIEHGGYEHPARPHVLTINEVGALNRGGFDPFDELAVLLAAAPELYHAACVAVAAIEAAGVSSPKTQEAYRALLAARAKAEGRSVE